jgi:drug/metabolite transporter (DMT)-like permease
MTPAAIAARNRGRVLLAFAAVYFIWGSTYLATRYAVEAVPPFLMGATRMLAAGLLLYAAARWRGADAGTAIEWKASSLSGILMLGLGNGSVIWSAQTVPSGIIALIVACVPIWMVLADWARPNGTRPGVRVTVGLVTGVVGMAVLIWPTVVARAGSVNPLGVTALVFGSMSWAIGSLVTRHRERPKSALVSIAIQMIAAGVFFVVMALAFAEPGRFSMSALTTRAVVSWVYLILGGSIVGYTAYVYLLGAVSPAKAATYAYVNPVIAVILGWAFANEPLGARTILAATVILAGVAIITTSSGGSATTGEHPVAVGDEKAA